MTSTLDLLLADDHPVFRKGLRDIITGTGTYRVVAEAADGEAALASLQELRPPIAILDLDMPKRSGLEVARSVRELDLPTNIIILTLHKDEFFFNEAMDAGVLGYVLKDSAINDILESIQAVAAGKYYISPLISGFLVTRASRQAELRATTPSLERLTPAERNILRLIALGKTTTEIAALLFISAKTVENHRTNISQKLGLHGTHSLVKFALASKSFLL
jgi:DNA-binding NarL/FixJ family response regulator